MPEVIDMSMALATVSDAELAAEVERRRERDEPLRALQAIVREYPGLVKDVISVGRELEAARRRAERAEAVVDQLVTIAAREACGLDPEGDDD